MLLVMPLRTQHHLNNCHTNRGMHNLFLRAKYSAIAALVFFIVANPELYVLTRMITGFADSGLIFVHTIIFFFTMLALMMVEQR